ncbi:restriction endonuclease subunit S [Elioraea sp.]|uniref:restriction endonuclease subunit S n=1 Tax=Elioraea sp. TaxID=2185103 RepID=UPI003F729999
MVPLAEVCTINPRRERDGRLAAEAPVGFVPMAAVDEADGAIRHVEVRPYAAVAKGFTPFRPQDVIFAKITPCMENGKSALVCDMPSGLGFGSTEFHVLRAGERVLPELVHRWVRRDQFRSEARTYFKGTAGQQRVPVDFFARALIPIPPLDEQRRIVDLLNRAAGIRRLREAALSKARDTIPALFLSMFGDPATNPMGWPMVRLGDVSDVQGGLQVTSRRASLPEEWPYLRVANVLRDHLDLSEIKMIRVTPAERQRVTLQRGDLLVVEGHGNPLEIGRVAVWDGSISICLHQNHLIRVRTRTDKLLPVVAAAYLNSEAGRHALLRSGKTTSGLNTISTSNVKAAPVPLAPLPRQHEFAARLGDLRAIITQQERALAAAKEMEAALLHRLLS